MISGVKIFKILSNSKVLYMDIPIFLIKFFFYIYLVPYLLSSTYLNLVEVKDHELVLHINYLHYTMIILLL